MLNEGQSDVSWRINISIFYTGCHVLSSRRLWQNTPTNIMSKQIESILWMYFVCMYDYWTRAPVKIYCARNSMLAAKNFTIMIIIFHFGRLWVCSWRSLCSTLYSVGDLYSRFTLHSTDILLQPNAVIMDWLRTTSLIWNKVALFFPFLLLECSWIHDSCENKFFESCYEFRYAIICLCGIGCSFVCSASKNWSRTQNWVFP